MRDELAVRLARVMRAEKITRLRWNTFEIELHPSAFAAAPAEVPTEAPQKVGVENGGMPTDEQLLMWSAGGELPRAHKDEVQS